MKIPTSLRWKATGDTLGQGGQATVFAVTDSDDQFKGVFALKALSRGKPAKAYERFAREVDAIYSIHHPAIINIVDHSSPDSDFPFYVMERHEGSRSLKRLLGTDDNPFFKNPRKSLALFLQILSAISACEEREIVHRDLSPANVLVLPDESIKIIDFGLCQLTDAETITLTDEGIGTPNYMAPECESGSSESVTTLADFYSAGKILWSAITNQHAFARETVAFGPKSMHTIFPDDPSTWHLHHAFAKTIRHDKKERWQTSSDALTNTHHIHFLVSAGYPPLELMNERCPLCGVGNLSNFQGSHMVFGNPLAQGISTLQCSYCGFCFARNSAMIRDALNRRSRLT